MCLSPEYLLNTHTVSRIVRKDSDKLRRKLMEMASLATSVITEAQVLFGLKRKPEATRLAEQAGETLLRLKKLTWSSEAAKSYAIARNAVESRGI